MSTTIGAVLVSAASVSFLSTIFTRDAFFSLTTFAAFWVFIFSDIHYDDIDAVTRYNYVLAAVLAAAVVAVVLIKLLGTGRLIDIWLTRSPLQLASTSEDWNIPMFLLALASAFLATFYGAAWISGPLWDGDIIITDPWNAIGAFFFGLLALLFILSAGLQKRASSNGFIVDDIPGIYYVVSWVIIIFATLLFWHLVTGLSIVTRGIVTGIIAMVLDAAFLTGGYLIEKWRANTTRTDTTKELEEVRRPYDGLFTGGSGWITFFRIFLISLVHGLIFIIGSLVDIDGGDSSTGTIDDTTDALTMQNVAKAALWFPYLMLLFTITAILFGVAYVIIVLLFVTNMRERNQLSYRYLSRAAPSQASFAPTSTPTTSKGRVSPPSEQTPQLKSDGVAQQLRSRAPGSRLASVTFV